MLVGWREWVSLPELGVKRIKAKIDTGARTSALHACEVGLVNWRGQSKIRFVLRPKQGLSSKRLTCEADLVDIRWVSDSGGHREQRYVIQTPIILGNRSWPIEITLTSRDDMRFRMLLGRTALKGQFWVDVAASYLLGKPL